MQIQVLEQGKSVLALHAVCQLQFFASEEDAYLVLYNRQFQSSTMNAVKHFCTNPLR